MAGADVVVVTDFLLLVPAVLPRLVPALLLRQLDALLLGLEPALLLLVLLALWHEVALVALDVLADLVLLLVAHLPRDNFALGLGNLLADALSLPRDGVLPLLFLLFVFVLLVIVLFILLVALFLFILLGPRLRLLFLLRLKNELLVGLVGLVVDLVLQLQQLLGHGPGHAGAVAATIAATATGGLVRERRRVHLRIIVLDNVGDHTDLNILADILVVRLALLLPDLLAMFLALALLLDVDFAL